MKSIDCRGMACPAPVISVKKALEEHTELRVLLDDGAPRENVSRFVRNRGYQLSEVRDGDGWSVTVIPGATPAIFKETVPSRGERVLLITSDRLGEGPEELGGLLMNNFIHTLLETTELPDRIFFMNRGVLLATEGSNVLETLLKLNGMGVEIFSCGLCLDFFNLKAKLRAGATTNMLTTVDSLLAAAQVINL